MFQLWGRWRVRQESTTRIGRQTDRQTDRQTECKDYIRDTVFTIVFIMRLYTNTYGVSETTRLSIFPFVIVFFDISGQQYWRLSYSQALKRIVTAGPYTIRLQFSGLEGNIDAVMTYRSITYFFKDSRVWRFVNNRVYRSQTRISNVFPGLPSDIDAAFVWSGNDQRYFVKGNILVHYCVLFAGVFF